jgi:hypothetical protein
VSRSEDIACRALAIASVAVVVAMASTSAAMAQPVTRAARPATALQTTAPACSNSRQIPGQTQGSVHCGTSATGGTAPYSYRWTGVTNNNRAFTSGFCTYGKDYVVSVTVTDATNTSVTRSSTNFCDPEGP